MQTQVDNVIGANWRCRPSRTGGRSASQDLPDEARRWSRAKWRSTPTISAAGSMPAAGSGSAASCARIHGMVHCRRVSRGRAWLPDRVGPGRARYATALQLVSPDRLSSPYGEAETAELRQGIHLPPRRAARLSHPQTRIRTIRGSGAESLNGRLPRETAGADRSCCTASRSIATARSAASRRWHRSSRPSACTTSTSAARPSRDPECNRCSPRRSRRSRVSTRCDRRRCSRGAADGATIKPEQSFRRPAVA